MAVLLKQKVRKQIEKAVSQGVPVMAAAAAFGVRPAWVATWLALGNSFEKAPAPPTDTERDIEMADGSFIPPAEWHLHVKECLALANAVGQYEGVMLTKLTTKMWKRALHPKKADPDMMKFLFKHYGHVHRLTDKAADMQSKSDNLLGDEDEKNNVVFLLPDNGRGPQ